MAYMNQQKKAALVPGIKSVLKKYKTKATIGVRNHSTLVIKISSGELDFMTNNLTCRVADNLPLPTHSDYLQVNTYHPYFSGRCLQMINELIKAANVGNHDRSDVQTDYFDVGWYVDITIGSYDKPYKLV